MTKVYFTLFHRWTDNYKSTSEELACGLKTEQDTKLFAGRGLETALAAVCVTCCEKHVKKEGITQHYKTLSTVLNLIVI